MKTIKELGIKSTNAFNCASYWNNNGAYQKEGDELYEKLVPPTGAATTLHGELIRGINRLFYEYCNNGNCNAVDVNYLDVDEDFEGIEEVKISEYYNKFIDLIENSLCDTICSDEIESICSDVREVIEGGANNSFCQDYYSRENVNKYNRMCDVVIWYVLNTEDRELPTNYTRE